VTLAICVAGIVVLFAMVGALAAADPPPDEDDDEAPAWQGFGRGRRAPPPGGPVASRRTWRYHAQASLV
jgi:hypothetical protein